MTPPAMPVIRPRLVANAAFWMLLIASSASIVVGLVLSVPAIGTMEAKLTDGSATGVEVYVGQAWITLGASLVGAGAIGIALALAIAAFAALRPRAVAASATPETPDPLVEPAAAEHLSLDETPATAEPADSVRV